MSDDQMGDEASDGETSPAGEEDRSVEPSPGAAPPRQIRLTIHFYGSVQGVGFRQATASLARSYAVTGYVKNLANGSVRLVVEGDEQVVVRFVGNLAVRMSSFIDRREERRSPATGEFTAFDIRY